MGKQKNNANPEIQRKMAVSALVTLVGSLIFFYLGNRYCEQLLSYEDGISSHTTEALGRMFSRIKTAPLHLDTSSPSILTGLALCIIIWIIWMYYIQNFETLRVGEENGSARWGSKKEGRQFLDTTNDDNNLLFTENYGLALSRPKFNQELDRNLNVLVVGGSGSGKTFNYVTPNICQLNTSYFITDPKGTLLQDAGFLFTDNGYQVKSFNTINLKESMHYNPLKYVKTDNKFLGGSTMNTYQATPWSFTIEFDEVKAEKHGYDINDLYDCVDENESVTTSSATP